MSLSLEGIGAILSTEDGITKIVRLIPGGPADKSGLLKVNDKITVFNTKIVIEIIPIIFSNKNFTCSSQTL